MMSILVLLLLQATASYAFPANLETEKKNQQLVQNYLEKFYKLNGNEELSKGKSANLIDEEIKKMQAFFHLKVTGKPDAETLEVMKQPRCGVPDVARFGVTTGNPKWDKTEITYRIVKYTRHLSKADVDMAIKKAFQVWSKVSPLTFTKVWKEEADIMISFFSGDHYDNSPFYGPDGVLAHAFPPGKLIGGDIHFDEDETWTKSHLNYNLFLVAAHEIGHALGLAHSQDIGALMSPVYSYMDIDPFKLPQDDIDGIQKIYGPSKSPIQPIGPETPQQCDPMLKFDAIFTLRGEIMFFKDRFLMRKHPSNPEVDLHFISALWASLPSGIEAAYENSDRDEVFVFKGNRYWVLKGFDVMPGYPKEIYETFGFPKTVKRIDAAFYDEITGKTYFFVGQKYWRYNENKQSMDPNFPQPLAFGFPGIGKKVDAVFKDQDSVYFFQGTRQYKFDYEKKRVLTLLKTNSWFNC
ncbi:interstitial collagenase isoform X1 [Ornithorhynchus anatinus]|nr:interstitial collagenase isoform X1 [Ornithorhynchus anatinus]